jgi:hypothetical protein
MASFMLNSNSSFMIQRCILGPSLTHLPEQGADNRPFQAIGMLIVTNGLGRHRGENMI